MTSAPTTPNARLCLITNISCINIAGDVTDFISALLQLYSRTMSKRAEVINLYKTLLHLGREYPHGYDYFRTRLKKAFMKNRNETDPNKIDTMIAHGNYVIKELEALYMLRKYRTLKRRYYGDN